MKEGNACVMIDSVRAEVICSFCQATIRNRALRALDCGLGKAGVAYTEIGRRPDHGARFMSLVGGRGNVSDCYKRSLRLFWKLALSLVMLYSRQLWSYLSRDVFGLRVS